MTITVNTTAPFAIAPPPARRTTLPPPADLLNQLPITVDCINCDQPRGAWCRTRAGKTTPFCPGRKATVAHLDAAQAATRLAQFAADPTVTFGRPEPVTVTGQYDNPTNW